MTTPDVVDVEDEGDLLSVDWSDGKVDVVATLFLTPEGVSRVKVRSGEPDRMDELIASGRIQVRRDR